MSLYNKTDKICNICRKNGALSEDHVPPKGVLLNKVVWMDNFGKQFQKDDGKRRIRFSQSGIRFKTICRECNNKLHDYDRKLADFSRSIHNGLIKNLHNPNCNEIEIECYPNAMMRSILGHLLSAKVETDNVVIDTSIRSFLFDETKMIPEKVNVYYWFYPFANVCIIRDFVRFFNGGQCSFNSVIKFPPVGFLINDLSGLGGLESLNEFKNIKPNYKTTIKLKLRPFNQEDWPEGVSNGGNPFIAFGKSFCNSLIAKPKKWQL